MAVADLEITRFAYTPMGTFGRYRIDGATYYTVERPWLDNLPNVSCIPTGTYTCKPRFYYRGRYQAIEVADVPGRTYILIHKGNTMHDVEGCILVTSRLGCLGGVWAGLGSAGAFDRLMATYPSGELTLEINDESEDHSQGRQDPS